MENYKDILSRMQENFYELAGFSADDASDIGIRLKILAGEIFSLESNIEWLKKQMFAGTATDDNLENHAIERGLKRKEAVKSEGILTFSRSSALSYDIEIPQGTICSTAESDGIRFETKETAILSAGDTSVSVAAKACEGGVKSNTVAKTIKVLVTPPAGITDVINSAAFTGGVDAETDEELRKRVLESYKNISNGTNIAFYKEKVLQYDGVYSAQVVPLARGNGTVNIYVASKGGVPSSDVISKIQNDIDQLREINVDILVCAAVPSTMNVKMLVKPYEGYSFSDVKAACEASITEYFNSLSVGEKAKIVSIGNKVYHTEGVENYSFIAGVSNDMAVDPGGLITLGTITINEKT